jgi:hypothetical protein
VGLGFIELRDKLEKADEGAPKWHRDASEHDLSVNGLYFRSQGDSRARIDLFARDLYRGVPKIYWLSPVITLIVAQTLSHEIGHHLIAERGYVFEPGEKVHLSEYEEEMAHRYAHHVVKKMRTRWYYRLAEYVIKDLASSHYIKGMYAWERSDYTRAAACWYRSFHLDPDRNDSIYWYKRAKEIPPRERAEDAESI